MTEQRKEQDVIECEAVPLEPRRQTPPRRVAPWVILLAFLFPAVVLIVALRFAAAAVAAVLALVRHPVGLVVIAAGAVWLWHWWRETRARHRA